MSSTSTTTCDHILKNSKIAIPRESCTDVGRTIASRRSDEEVEVRFGHIVNGKHISGLAGSATESPRDMWYRLLRLLRGSRLYTTSKIEKTLSESFGDLRKVTDLGVPSQPIYQEKKRISVMDLLTFRIGEITHSVRLNRATEKTRPPVTRGTPDYTRMRTRISFTSTDGSHRIDMTYVSPLHGSDGGSGRTAYEVEIEYLRALTNAQQDPDLQAFFAPIKIVMFIIKEDKAVVTASEFTQIIQVYNSFFASEAKFDPTKMYKRALPQPINLKRSHISRMTAYAVTNKLNGTRVIGIISDGDLYAINMVGNVMKLAQNLPVSLNKSVFDAELFKDVLYVFDLLFDKGENTRGSNLDIRLTRAARLIETINHEKVKLKPFEMSGNLEADTTKMLEYIRTLPEDDNDGLIYTPITLPYRNEAIYKWKPPHMLTIDFLAQKIGDNQYTLQVRDKNDRNITFSPRGFNGTVQSSRPLIGVGEYHWTGSTFELVRPRLDKDAPNFITIAQDVWEDIQNPITEEDLPSLFAASMDDADALRKYHNSIKRDLIELLTGNTVLDLGAGKGGDLGKYHAAKIKSLYAVEPNDMFVVEMKMRADGFMAKKQLSFPLEIIHTRAQNTDFIRNSLRGQKVSSATMFFSLSFFFENNLSLTELVNTISSSVEQHGFFMGTTIDGEAVRRLLTDKSEVTLGRSVIRKQYRDFTGPIEFGKAIDYSYKNSETVVDVQREYLVDWDLFVQRLTAEGFELTESSIFPAVDYLSPKENQLSQLYRRFFFTRESYVREKKYVPAVAGKEVKHLSRARVNSTLPLKSILTTELKEQDLDYQLTRTGVHANGDCFFHATQMSLNPTNYRQHLLNQTAIEFVQNYRKSLKITKEHWVKLVNGSLARIGSNTVNGFDSNFFNYLAGDDSKYMGSTYNISIALGQNMKRFTAKITRHEYSVYNVLDFAEKIKEDFLTFIIVGDVKNAAVQEMNNLIESAIEKTFTDFVALVTNSGEHVGQEVLELIGDHIDRDIYILSDLDGGPYRTECKHTKNRESIILLYQGGDHYESVGRHLPGNVIQRTFSPDDPLIQSIRRKIC